MVYGKSFGHFKVFAPRWTTTGVRVVSSKKGKSIIDEVSGQSRNGGIQGIMVAKQRVAHVEHGVWSPQNSNKPDTKVPADSTRNPQDNLVGDLRLSLPLFTT